MALYWGAEAGALWASLRAFGISCTRRRSRVLGLATAYVLTPRGLPLAGAGIAEVLLPVSLMWLGVPLAAAVPAALARGVRAPRRLAAAGDRGRATRYTASSVGSGGRDEAFAAGDGHGVDGRPLVHTSSSRTGGETPPTLPATPEIHTTEKGKPVVRRGRKVRGLSV